MVGRNEVGFARLKGLWGEHRRVSSKVNSTEETTPIRGGLCVSIGARKRGEAVERRDVLFANGVCFQFLRRSLHQNRSIMAQDARQNLKE
jgi:hypothetical protein